MLSKKETEFVKKSLSGATLNPETILDMINRKRSDSKKVTLKDLYSVIENQQEENGSKNQDTHSIKAAVKPNKSLIKLEESIQFEKISKIVRGVLNEVGPTIDKLTNPSLPEDYFILSDKTQGGLMLEVRNYMKNGWVPLGGVSAAAFGISPVGGNQYIQAMVKY